MKENAVREAGLDTGLLDTTVCAVDAYGSCLRVVQGREDRPALRIRRESQ